MLRNFTLVIVFIFTSCGVDFTPSPTKQPLPEDINTSTPNAIPDVFTILDIPIYNPLNDYTDQYKEDCLKQVFLRCPPYTEYWIADAWIDVCDDYAIILIENCRMQHECDPLEPLIVSNQPCQMPDGGDGVQDVFCDKGKVQIGDCTPCTEEICDGIDNDCDGLIDEGDYTCETECGTGPAYCVNGSLICEAETPKEEVCDYIDNDCDGEIDEGQRNACDSCGEVPEDVCNGVDDDCDGNTDENLVRECETVCESGYETCIFGQWDMCTAQQPLPEICDGEDNDCNGLVDDGIVCQCQLQDIGILIPCFESPLICGQGYKSCECKLNTNCAEFYMTECQAACTLFGFLPCDPILGQIFPEMCNNWDDNCNQQIDENLYKTCYTGPEETMNIGECKPGILTCIAGQWGGIWPGSTIFMEDYCEGQVLPIDEICNGKDDDCDGIIEEELQETDIVFIIDTSGSMGDEINAVISALIAFSMSYQDEPNINWAVVVGPYRDYSSTMYKEVLDLKTNLGPFSGFMASVQNLASQNLNGGHEPLLDAIYLVINNIADPGSLTYQPGDFVWKETNTSSPAIPAFNISWREDSIKAVVVFTDEPAQSKTDPRIDRSDVINAINGTEDLKVFIFSPTGTKIGTDGEWDSTLGQFVTWQSGWEAITFAGDTGQWYELTNNTTEIFNNLMEILEDTACAPTSE